jgi:peroxiredoxin family protein
MASKSVLWPTPHAHAGTMPAMPQILPSKEPMATPMMKNKIKPEGMSSLQELRDICIESGVKFVACQMMVDLLEFETSDFLKDLRYGDATTPMKFAGESAVCLFIQTVMKKLLISHFRIDYA